MTMALQAGNTLYKGIDNKCFSDIAYVVPNSIPNVGG